MIKLTWDQIRNESFNEAVNKLIQNTHPAKISYRLSKIATEISKQQELAQKTFRLLAEKFFDKTDDKENPMKIKEGQDEAWEQAVIGFRDTTFTIDKWHPFTLDELQHVTNMTAADFAAMDCLLKAEDSEEKPNDQGISQIDHAEHQVIQ